MKENKRNLLIIDDDELYANALKKRLDRVGFNSRIMAKNTSELIPFIGENKIEIILLDLVMPEVDGISLLKEIRSEFSQRELPILIISGMDSNADIADAFEHGATDYITKPLRTELAIARIKAHLSQCDINKEFVRSRELEVLNAMIVTYCHELNNPLCIALCLLDELEKKKIYLEKELFQKLRKVLLRMCDTLSLINKTGTASNVELQEYANGVKMVKVK